MNLDDIYRLLRTGHVQAQGVVDTLDEPLVVLDQGLRVVTANPAFLNTFHTDRDQTMGSPLFSLGNGQWDIPELRQLLSGIIPRATAVIDFAVTHTFPAIGTRTFLVTARRLAHPDGNSQQILVSFTDVTDRQREDAAKDILLHEARHRITNLLTVVRSLAEQTRVEGVSAEAYRAAFIGRLQALAAVQDLVFGGMPAIDLDMLVRRVLEPYLGRMDVEAVAPIELSKSQVQPIGMILQELATNAVKFGALAVPQGSVELIGTIDTSGHDPVLSIKWTERNGPPVAEPGREGFGTRLIRHTVRVTLEGELELAYGPGGLEVRIKVPLADAYAVERPDQIARQESAAS